MEIWLNGYSYVCYFSICISLQYKRILLLSGGTGITPVLQILNQVLGNEDDVTYIYVIHSSLDASNIIMLEELRQWNAHWNCDIRFCLTGVRRCS